MPLHRGDKNKTKTTIENTIIKKWPVIKTGDLVVFLDYSSIAKYTLSLQPIEYNFSIIHVTLQFCFVNEQPSGLQCLKNRSNDISHK